MKGSWRSCEEGGQILSACMPLYPERCVDGFFNRLPILLLVVFTVIPRATQTRPLPAKLISFPEHSRAVSPDGRYSITGVYSESEPYHTVFLDDRQLKTRRELFSYSRSIE